MVGLRVLVAEDHEQVRKSVVELLSLEFEVVGAVEDGEQLVRAAIQFQPDVIVSDISMPVMDGLIAREQLLSKKIACPFVFITMFEGRPTFDRDPVAYVHKRDLLAELNLAVRAVSLGQSYASRMFRESR